MVQQVYQRGRPLKSSGLSRLTPYLLSVLRIVAAFVYTAHGTQKLFGVPGHPFHAPVFAATMIGAAGVIETIGGMAMLLGLFTRPVAFILSGQMAIAFFTQHWPNGFWPINNGGDLAVVFCFLWLFFCVAGPGPISLDALRGRR
jgi:putative oxidoreductase